MQQFHTFSQKLLMWMQSKEICIWMCLYGNLGLFMYLFMFFIHFYGRQDRREYEHEPEFHLFIMYCNYLLLPCTWPKDRSCFSTQSSCHRFLLCPIKQGQGWIANPQHHPHSRGSFPPPPPPPPPSLSYVLHHMIKEYYLACPTDNLHQWIIFTFWITIKALGIV